MKLKQLFMCILSLFWVTLFTDCTVYYYGPYYPVPITTSENTYIRFRFENKRTEVEKQLLNDKDRYWKLFLYNFQVSLWTNSRQLTHFKEFRTVNPTIEYWQRYYRKGTKYFRIGLDSLDFVEGCDYKMPVPVGKNKYKFYFHSKEPRHFADMIKTINVPANHSIRVIFDIDGPPQEEDEDPDAAKTRNNKYQIPMRVKIEPNPDPDEDKICEVPND